MFFECSILLIETKKPNILVCVYFYEFQFKKTKPLHLMSRRHFNRYTTTSSINKEKVGDTQSTIFASECLVPTKESVDSDDVQLPDEHVNTIEDLGLLPTKINFGNNFNNANIPCGSDNIVNQSFKMSSTPFENYSSFNKKFCQLIIKYKISHNCVNELLEILRSVGLDVLKDVRTLLKTPKSKSHEINHIANGSYKHIGVEFMIKPVLQLYFDSLIHLDTLLLSVNVDGLSTTNISKSSFWPIL